MLLEPSSTDITLMPCSIGFLQIQHLTLESPRTGHIETYRSKGKKEFYVTFGNKKMARDIQERITQEELVVCGYIKTHHYGIAREIRIVDYRPRVTDTTPKKQHRLSRFDSAAPDTKADLVTIQGTHPVYNPRTKRVHLWVIPQGVHKPYYVTFGVKEKPDLTEGMVVTCKIVKGYLYALQIISAPIFLTPEQQGKAKSLPKAT